MLAERIIANSDLSYDRVEILPNDVVPYDFNEFSVVFKKGPELYVVPEWQISVVHLNRKFIKDPSSLKVKRISIDDDITDGPAYILPECCWEKYNIPYLIRNCKQFVYTSINGTFISPESNVALIQFC